MNKKLMLITLVLSGLVVTNYVMPCHQNYATPYLNIRSQGVNLVRDILGWQNLINRCEPHGYGACALVVEFDQTFAATTLAKTLFGNDALCDFQGATLGISGSRAAGRGSHDWLADYFALPLDFMSTISFKPRIQNIIADIEWYVDLDTCLPGLYIRGNIPFVHTSWDLNFCETVINPGVQSYPQGYFSPSTCIISRALLNPNATAFFCGDDTTDLIRPLEASKWSCDCTAHNKNIVAAVNAVVGWNFICCDTSHFGLNLRVSAPTGSRPRGEYFFEPVVGNGHHWELGGGFSAHTELWKQCNDATLSFYIEGYATHLFKTCQTRSFDLCGRPNSRYMLAQNMGPNIEGLAGCTTSGTVCTDPTLSVNQFADILTPVANLTKTLVDVSIAVQTDIVCKLSYITPCGFEADLGYNFWARSCEKICRNCCSSKNPLANGSSWALKGDAMVYGFQEISGRIHGLAATQHCATIHAGTNNFVPGNDSANALPLTNPGIDNPQFAVIPQDNEILTNFSGRPINTSIQPIYLTNADVDMSGTRGLSHKIFAHLSYTWHDCSYLPFLGVGASVEFGKNIKFNNKPVPPISTSPNCFPQHCNNQCHPSTLNQWGMWIKAGLVFDSY